MESVFSLDEIQQAATQLLPLTATHKVIAFHGGMGAGKTTFIHQLCELLGITGAISSPTYSIINQYKAGDGQLIYHMDLYRLKDEEEALNAGVEDCLYSGQLCLVEWPEKAPGIFPPDTLHIELSVVDHLHRKIKW